jgi:D-alanyl-D-alanine carboxypeptidase
VILRAILLLVAAVPAAANPLQPLADALVAGDPAIPSVVIHATAPAAGINWIAAAAGARETGPVSLAARPFRIASTTKLFTAAAILRLVETGRIGLDMGVDRLLSPQTVAMLAGGGHAPYRITVRWLLTHRSGLPDHAELPAFQAAIMANPQRRWQRSEQIALAMQDGRPVGAPGAVWSYSDTGYLLLAEVIERQTGRPWAAALRHLLTLDHLGLPDTWFETLEPPPRGTAARPLLRQYLGDLDITSADPSFDLWGGGGLVSTVTDLVRLMRALQAGALFSRRETRDLALSDQRPVAPGSDTLHGLVFFHEIIAGHRCIGHPGFWNVDLVACPSLDLVLAVSLNQPITKRPGERRALVAAIVTPVAAQTRGQRLRP